MILLDFIRKESDAPKGRILLMAAISGLSNGLLLALINLGAEHVWNESIEVHLFIMYFTAFVLFIYTQKYSLSQAILALEAAIRKVRVRIADKVRRTEVLFIEHIGRNEIYSKLTQESNVISQSAIVIVSSAQSSLVLLFSLLYIAWLSPLSFFIITVTLVLLTLRYLSINKEVSAGFQSASLKETDFFNSLSQILEGFKEIKINHHKSDDLFHQIETISVETEQLKAQAGIQSITIFVYNRTALYLLLALLVFIVPLYTSTQTPIIFKITAATLFIIAPLNLVVFGLPMLARANVALKNLYDLEAKLDAAVTKNHYSDSETIEKFQMIQLSQVVFHYFDEENKPMFSIGPLSWTLHRGELLFIVGGNGSGKSTLLKLLTGLYYPKQGHLYVDGEEIDEITYQGYRELFSIIFTDFHLFDRLYGLRTEVDKRRVKELLRLMKLEKKTKYMDGKFTHLDLSTGQRKRLAFLIAVLENKPIYVFDELVADQDPEFRKTFYEIILPDLKKQGKTIVMATHDEKYFHTADHVLKMEEGQLFPIR